MIDRYAAAMTSWLGYQRQTYLDTSAKLAWSFTVVLIFGSIDLPSQTSCDDQNALCIGFV